MDSTAYAVVIAIVSITIIICSMGIIVAVRIQRKQKKTFADLKKTIEEKEDITFSVKDSLTPEEINNIDPTIDVGALMANLYQTFLTFQDKVKNFDSNLDNVLTGYLKDFYVNKINNFKVNSYADTTDNIELIGYSISEFQKAKLKFRINISCINYKSINGKIVSGSNTYRLEQIIFVTYEKIGELWLISTIDKAYEKKIGG